MGIFSSGRSGHMQRHIPRAIMPCFFETPLWYSVVRSANAVILNPTSRVTGMLPELEKGVLIDAKLRIISGEIFFHEIKGKNIIPGRDRRMGGKDRGPFHLDKGILECHPFFHAFPDPLQLGKRRVPFIRCRAENSIPRSLSTLRPPIPSTISCCRRCSVCSV